jgi:hypothetical protein
MTTDAARFVAQCHVCLSNKHSRVSTQVPPGQFDQTVEPSVEMVADPVGPLP